MTLTTAIFIALFVVSITVTEGSVLNSVTVCFSTLSLLKISKHENR